MQIYTTHASGFGELVSDNDVVFDAANDISTVNSTITATAHNLETGESIRLDDGGNTAPTGLLNGQVYFVIVVDENTLQLAATYNNAIASVPVPVAITLAGTGNNTLVVVTIIQIPRARDGMGVMVLGTGSGILIRRCYALDQNPQLWYTENSGNPIVGNSVLDVAGRTVEFSGDGSFSYFVLY